jgi:LysR family transcriptional regulator, cys regulon transcriptional activator
MTLTQLRYLVAIADAGLNITLAAERVHATQPGLSKQLKQLEEELGFLLFARRGRSLAAVTPGGAQVLERARGIVASADNILALAANQRESAQGELTVVTTHTQARFVLPRAVAAVRRDYPEVSVHLQPVGDSDVLGMLARGHADLAVLSTSGQVPAGDVALPLFRWRRVVLVPNAHPLAGLRRAPTLEELAAHPLVSYESALSPESSLRRAFEARGLLPQLALTARDADLIKTYVRAGVGVGLLAEMALLPDDAADLSMLAAPDAIPECVAWAVLPRERVLRDYSFALLRQLAPQIDRRDLKLALEYGEAGQWPPPPTWGELVAAAR